MKSLLILSLVALSVLLSACDLEVNTKAEQIKAQSEADTNAVQVQQEALNAEQMRRQQEALNQLALQKEEQQNQLDIQALAAQKSREEATKTIIWERVNMIWNAGLLVVCGVTIFGLFSIGRQSVMQINRVQEGIADAMITRVNIRARLLPLDRETGQFPAYFQLDHTGRHTYALVDLNGQVVLKLDERNAGDAQMITGMIAVRHTGVATRNTRKALKDVADAVPLAANPPIIEAKASDMARELFGDFMQSRKEAHGDD